MLRRAGIKKRALPSRMSFRLGLQALICVLLVTAVRSPETATEYFARSNLPACLTFEPVLRTVRWPGDMARKSPRLSGLPRDQVMIITALPPSQNQSRCHEVAPSSRAAPPSLACPPTLPDRLATAPQGII